MRKLLVFGVFVMIIVAIAKIQPAAQTSPEAPLAALATPPPESDTIKFNSDDYYRRQRLHRGDVSLEYCMDDAMMTIAQQGVTSKAQILGFAEDTCGSAFRKALIFEGASEKAATDYVHLMAQKHLAIFLARIGQ